MNFSKKKNSKKKSPIWNKCAFRFIIIAANQTKTTQRCGGGKNMICTTANKTACTQCGKTLDDIKGHLRIGCGAFLPDIEQTTIKNVAFRRVLITTTTQQLTVMHLNPGEDIGTETHSYTTQSIRIVKGRGYASVDRGLFKLDDQSWVTIPPNNEHNVWADADGPGLWLYSIYSPPVHPAGAVHPTKADAMRAERNH